MDDYRWLCENAVSTELGLQTNSTTLLSHRALSLRGPAFKKQHYIGYYYIMYGADL